MSLKEDHIDGCGCPSCHDMQNIDGYASGMELVPDPNQHLSPDLTNDHNFIASIVQQVLQQMNLVMIFAYLHNRYQRPLSL